MANKLNMMIAKTHQLSSRIVGMQITTGTLIGVILSATQMSVGFEIVGQGVTHGNLAEDGGIGVIGVSLAILVERLSITGLAGVRVASERKHRLEDAFYQLCIEREPTQAEQGNFDRQIKKLDGEILRSTIFAVIGIVLSAALGDQFWRTLFASQGIGGEVLAIACAAVISLTFVHSEIYKTLVDGVLKEILADLHLQKVAVAAQEQVQQVDMMVESYDEVRDDEEAYQSAKNKVKRIIGRRLSSFAEKVGAVGNEMDALEVRVVEGSLAPLQLPSPRGKYGYYREELARLLRANPGLLQRDIANHFGISQSTASDWLKKIKAGV
jgi:DNA-binding Lrp family transcriptional regulator